MKIKLYRCPCCGCFTLIGRPFEICRVCFWEYAGTEDDSSRYDPYVPDGANDVPLVQARRNYKDFGAVSERLLPYVSPPEEFERTPTEAESVTVELQPTTEQALRQKLMAVCSGSLSRNALASWAERLIDWGIPSENPAIPPLLEALALIEDSDDAAEDHRDIRDMLHALRHTVKIKVRKEAVRCDRCQRVNEFFYLSDFSYGQRLIRLGHTNQYAFADVTNDVFFEKYTDMVKDVFQEKQIAYTDATLGDFIERTYGMTCDPIDGYAVDFSHRPRQCAYCCSMTFERNLSEPESVVEIEVCPVTHVHWRRLSEKEQKKQIEECIQ